MTQPPERPSGGGSVSERLEIPVAGGSLAAFRLGPDAGAERTVVAVHGITANSRAWLAVARALESEIAVVAVDLRGRGESNSLPGPYGLAAHVQDLLSVVDHLALRPAVLAGHSLGAYVVARLAAEHPERVEAVVLVDGGLALPAPPDLDPQAAVDAGLGPALARLRLSFESLDAYVHWWRSHPAFTGGEIADRDLRAYAAHDLVGQPPALRSGVAEAAVRADAQEAFDMGRAAHHLAVQATLLRAPRGLLNQPEPFQPPDLARQWVGGAPEQRRVLEVPDVNHYSLVMGERGAAVAAGAIRAAMRAPGPVRAPGPGATVSGRTESP